MLMSMCSVLSIAWIFFLTHTYPSRYFLFFSFIMFVLISSCSILHLPFPTSFTTSAFPLLRSTICLSKTLLRFICVSTASPSYEHEMELWITSISTSLFLLSLLTFLLYFPVSLYHWLCRVHFLWTLSILAHFNAGLYLTYFHRNHIHPQKDAHSEQSCVYYYCLCDTWIFLHGENRASDMGMSCLTETCRCCGHYQRWQEILHSSFISFSFPSL